MFYPHPRRLPLWKIAACVLSWRAFPWPSSGRPPECPYMFVGWLWYLGTLVPVIGLVQVGLQAMADR